LPQPQIVSFFSVAANFLFPLKRVDFFFPLRLALPLSSSGASSLAALYLPRRRRSWKKQKSSDEEKIARAFFSYKKLICDGDRAF